MVDIRKSREIPYEDLAVRLPKSKSLGSFFLEIAQPTNLFPLSKVLLTTLPQWRQRKEPTKPPQTSSDSNSAFLDRLLFYLILRAERRYAADFIRAQAEDARLNLHWQAFEKEKKTLTEQIALLQELRDRSEAQTAPSQQSEIAFTLLKGVFATSCVADCTRSGSLKVLNVKKLPEDFCDVIVTDPPYGFNTNEEIGDFARLYAAMFEKLVLALRSNTGGQIVIAIPDWSHTGRQLPLFALRRLITQQILIAAARHSKEVNDSTHISHLGDLIRPPYYWESERPLRRAILHFRIKPRRSD